MGVVLHADVRCPRCAARGARELNRLPEEGHAVLMCPFCKHTWCEAGRSRPPAAAVTVTKRA
jgi:hypothetical protein